jgi:hypothetical protein
MTAAIATITRCSAASRLPSASAGVSGSSRARTADDRGGPGDQGRYLVGGQMAERLVVAVVEAEQLGDEQPERQERERPGAADRDRDGGRCDRAGDQVGDGQHAAAASIAPPAPAAP